jgi:hypothetical protein
MNHVRVTVLSLLCVLALATSASAVAWVLWLETVSLEETKWDYTDAYTTKDECWKIAQGYNQAPTQLGRSARQGETITSIGYRCVPDTVDPRGPK